MLSNLVRKLADPVRRGYFAEMLFPTWADIRIWGDFTARSSTTSQSSFDAEIYAPKQRFWKGLQTMKCTYSIYGPRT